MQKILFCTFSSCAIDGEAVALLYKESKANEMPKVLS